MSKITFIGDVMLGRMIGSKYNSNSYNIVDGKIQKQCRDSDLVIANLESPVTYTKDANADHLQFVGSEGILKEFTWIDLFSLANNHINDAGETGMDETIAILSKNGYSFNGLFKKDEVYTPFVFSKDGNEISVITLTDMMNIPFDEDNKWQCLRVGEKRIYDIISNEKRCGRFVIVFAHIGALFTRYPNPSTFNYLHELVDSGADCIVSCHSHCLGGMENYKGVPIFHSIGDFVMDGNSFRRRRSAMLTIDINDKKINSWHLTPAIIDNDYRTVPPNKATGQRMLADFMTVSQKIIKHQLNYSSFYKWQYKKEMLLHTSSTLNFLIRTRGFIGMIRLLMLRFEEVGRMFKWVATDRSKVQRDDDAIKANRKKFSQEQIFGNS